MPTGTESKCKKRITGSAQRAAHGSGIIVGLLGVFLLVSGCVLAVLLAVNTGVATYNKEKIGFIAYQAAAYAANCYPYLPDASVRQANVADMVNGLLTKMGLHSSNTIVSVSDTTLNGQAAVSVSVSANLATITAAGFSSVFSQEIEMTNTAVVQKAKNPYATAYLVGVHPFGGKVTVFLNSPNNNNSTAVIPNQGQDVWSIGLDGLHKMQ